FSRAYLKVPHILPVPRARDWQMWGFPQLTRKHSNQLHRILKVVIDGGRDADAVWVRRDLYLCILQQLVEASRGTFIGEHNDWPHRVGRRKRRESPFRQLLKKVVDERLAVARNRLHSDRLDISERLRHARQCAPRRRAHFEDRRRARTECPLSQR